MNPTLWNQTKSWTGWIVTCSVTNNVQVNICGLFLHIVLYMYCFVYFYLVALQADFSLWSFCKISFGFLRKSSLWVFLEKRALSSSLFCCHWLPFKTIIFESAPHVYHKPCRQHLMCNSIKVTPLNSSWLPTSCFQAWGFSVLMVNLHSFRNTKCFVLWSLQVNKWKVFALV